MNNTFNFARFERLFVKHTVEHYRTYLMSMLVLSGLAGILYIFILLTGGALQPGLRFTVLTFFYILSGCLFTSSIFLDFTQKDRAIGALTLPASHFEKFLVGWIYSYLIFTLAFAVCFGLVDYGFAKLAPARTQSSNLLNVIPGNGLTIVFLVYSVLHGFVLFGSAYFKRLHFVKTALYFFAVVSVLCLFHQFFLKMLIPNEELIFNVPIMVNAVTLSSKSMIFHHIRLEKSEQQLYIGLMVVGVTTALWAASFFQIKEKQI